MEIMTKEEAAARLEEHKIIHQKNEPMAVYISEALDMAIKVLEQQPCEEVISRQAVLDDISRVGLFKSDTKEVQAIAECLRAVEALPSVTLQSKTGHCKECKYFEYDRVANIDGIPLIVAHEICSRWGDGCKTNEGGYCFLFEPKKSEG